MASFSAADPWWDFTDLRHKTSHNTVDKLKHIITGLNDECNANLPKTGKKQELIERINSLLDGWKSAGNLAQWTRAKAVLYAIRNSGSYTPNRTPAYNPPSYSYASTSKVDGYGTDHLAAAARLNSNIPPRNGGSALPAYPNVGKPGLVFKYSPFLRVEQAVSNVVECPESCSSMDRRTASVYFTLTPDQQAKLKSHNPSYQLRLYCTSSSYHSPQLYRPSPDPCPVEFPPTCEVRVNQQTLNANTKGLKKKPGTAPPANISKEIKSVGQNRVELVYVNNNAGQAGTPSKRYFMVVQLVEVTSVDQLVDRLKKGKYRESSTIVDSMRKQAAADDDDIVAGPQKMSLRDSLTLCRVDTPTRSSKCVHPSCFDAATWFSMMEQTTTWLCPICDKVLDPDDLIVDGYFESILNATSDEVDDVMVEADGEWHTSDNKFASDAWRATHSATTPAPAKREPSPVTAKSAPAAEIVHILVDSDEEDEGRVKRELSPNGHASSSFSSLDGGHPPPPSQTPSRQGSRIIDLTLDSDDEMASAPPTVTRPMPLSNASLPARPGPPPLSVPQKRKATEDGYSTPDAAWKKARGPDGSSPSMHHSPHVSASASASASRTHALPGVSYPHGVAQRSSPEAYRYRSPPMSASDFSGFTSASGDSRTTSNASTAGSFVHRYPSSPYAASRPSDASSSRWT